MRTRLIILAVLALFALSFSLILGCGSSGGGGPTTPGGGLTIAFSFPAQGASRTQVFADAGTYDYRCSPHGGSGMTGRVSVAAASMVDSALVNVGSGGLLFNPSVVTIKPGGSVRWVNVSGLTNHTVTYP